MLNEPIKDGRSKKWNDIWNARGAHMSDSLTPLYAVDGWDMLGNYDWDAAITRILTKQGFSSVHDILEVGCGAGGFLDVVQRFYPEVQINGFDFSQELVDIADDRLIGNFRLYNALEENWDIDSQFDLVSSFSVFQYFNGFEEAYNVLCNMYKAARPGGMIYIGDVPDMAKQTMAERERSETTKSYLCLRADIKTDHQYFPKHFFQQIPHCNVEIIDHIELLSGLDFPNITSRYSVFICKHEDD